MSLNLWKAIILQRMQEILEPAGFQKKGTTFSADREDVLLIVNLQSSSSTTQEKLKATINLGVYSKTLASKLGVPVKMASIWDAHWRIRIGQLLPERNDKW